MSGIYAWLRRHPVLVDSFIALPFFAIGLAQTLGALGPARVGVGGFVYVLIVLPLPWRRKRPALVLGIVAAAAILHLVFNEKIGPSDAVVLIAGYTAAAIGSRRLSLTALGLGLSGSAICALIEGGRTMGQKEGTLIFLEGTVIITWLLGDATRTRKQYLAELEDRAERLERERDAQAQIAAAAERARIARELHDVVAHNVSVMVVQADGASYAFDSSPGEARRALTTIAETGRSALTEMRRLLGVLRNEVEGTAFTPQPGVAQLSDLLDQVRVAGLPVSFTVEGVPSQLPPGVALAAYRIVQESLTNTRKHGGPRVSASVALCYGEDELVMTISDDGRGKFAVSDGAGHGMIGMRERVALYGGTLRAGPRAIGGYEVVATLPYALRKDAEPVAGPVADPVKTPEPEPTPTPAPAPKPSGPSIELVQLEQGSGAA